MVAEIITPSRHCRPRQGVLGQILAGRAGQAAGSAVGVDRTRIASGTDRLAGDADGQVSEAVI
jgi:hypothetical protein